MSETRIAVGGGRHVTGDLVVPRDAAGAVVFAHGSGSSRHSPRNRAVAEYLNRRGFATLLMDLLTPTEEGGPLRFDIPLLAGRLGAAVDRLAGEHDLPIGLFGASTGAAAALVAAADRTDRVAAVVSRGGRPDLAGDALRRVTAPTLLIVGGHDEQVLELNRLARDAMKAPCQVEVVPRATHLFEEPGALERVAERAAAWFQEHLTARSHAGGRR
jgi:putative phosphoribosyl transferase